jgi:hypothetical protein
MAKKLKDILNESKYNGVAHEAFKSITSDLRDHYTNPNMGYGDIAKDHHDRYDHITKLASAGEHKKAATAFSNLPNEAKEHAEDYPEVHSYVAHHMGSTKH